MLRFIHTADWQIGRAFSLVEGDAAARLRQARVDVLDRIGEIARAEGAACVLVAGDVFDAEGLANTTLLAPLERMRRFPEVTWHLLPGNHDPDRREGLWDRLARLGLPDNVHALLEAAPLQLTEDAWLLPCPLSARASLDDPTHWMDSAPTPAGAIRIGLAHGSIREFGSSEQSMRAPLAPDRAERAGLQYLALGDWHRMQQVTPRTWYSGTPEPDRFAGPRELATGHVLSVSVEGPRAPAAVRPVACGQFQWAELNADLHERADIDALEASARNLSADPGRLYLRLRVQGALSLADRSHFDVRIREALRAAILALELEDSRLAGEPDMDDLDAIDKPGGLLRLTAERLASKASDPGSADSATARRALAMLFAYAQDNGGGTSAR